MPRARIRWPGSGATGNRFQMTAKKVPEKVRFPRGEPPVVKVLALARVQVAIALNEHTDARGELVFRQACAMGREGIVSKRLTAPYPTV